MEAAQILHFPNFEWEKEPYRRTRITFIDLNADKEKDEFITRNRHFFEIQPYYYSDLTIGNTLNNKPIEDYLFFKDEKAKFLDGQFIKVKGFSLLEKNAFISMMRHS